MKVSITPPQGALPGKAYVRDSMTGLLLMTNPTLQDVLACRGIYFEYQTSTGVTNALFLAGRAFDEYAKLAQHMGADYSAVASAANLAVQFVKNSFKFSLILSKLRTTANNKATSGFTLPTAVPIGVTITAVYAVPHNLLSGYWQTNKANLTTCALLYDNGVPPNAVSLNANTLISDPQTVHLGTNGALFTSRNDWGNDQANALDGTSGWRGLPTYVSITTLPYTYSAALDKLLNGVTAENSSEAKVALKAMIVAELAAKGVNLGSYVVQPLVYGGYADSLRVLGDGFGLVAPIVFNPFTVRPTNTTATVRDSCGPLLGTLAPISKTDLRMPTMLIGDGFDNASPVYPFRPYLKGQTDVAMTWSSAAPILCKTIGGVDSRRLLAMQPFGALYNDDRTLKTLPDGDIDIAATFDKVRSYTRQATVAAPTFVEQSGNTVQAQESTYYNSARACDLALSEICSIGETYAVTPRALISMVNDGLVLSGDNVSASLQVVKMVMRCFPLDSNTNATI